MWVFTETGFVSAVVHFDDPEMLMVRARDRVSLEGLAKVGGAEVYDTLEGDYPHRVVVSKQAFQDWLLERVAEMSYHNYKSRVAEVRGYAFAAPLHDVWEVMHEVEEDPQRKYRGSDYFDYPVLRTDYNSDRVRVIQEGA